MIVIKIGTIIIGTKIVSINQVLITIHTNPIVRNKAKCYFRHSLQHSVPMAIFIFIYISPWLYLYLHMFIFIYMLYNVIYYILCKISCAWGKNL